MKFRDDLDVLPARASSTAAMHESGRRSVIARSALVGSALLAVSLAGCNDSGQSGSSTPPNGGGNPGTGSVRQEDVDLLHFLLTFKYLEAEFYSRAAFGVGLPDALLGRIGQRGDVVGPRLVNFARAAIAAQVREIAFDKIDQITVIRQQLFPLPQSDPTLDTTVARPAIDLSGSQTGAFSQMARLSGIVSEAASFDPYSSDDNFLLSSFFLSDVAVGLCKQLIGKVQQQAYAGILAGILGCDSYHAASIRFNLYRATSRNPDLSRQIDAVCRLRDTLAGTQGDQGVVDAVSKPNLSPTDGSGLVNARTPGQVLNILYLNSGSVQKGGFFPAGINANIKKSGTQ